MKRKLLFLTGIVVMSMLILSSCKKQDPTSLVLETGKTATISGEVYAQLDYSNSVTENAPNGTRLFITVSNSEYLAGAQGVTIFETTVGSDGKYTFTIPVTDEGINITIEGEDFDYNVVINDDGDTQYTIFTGGVMTGVTGAITNGNYIRDFSY
jgi:hypothetical protein